MTELRIEAGSDTSDLISELFNQLSDDQIDEIELTQETAPTPGIASEPTTIAAVLVFSAVVAPVIERALEVYFTNRAHDRDWDRIEKILTVHEPTQELLKMLENVSKNHANVRVKQGPLPKISSSATMSAAKKSL
ncbi:hypothetical protein AAFX91_15010 [Bradyrhizobium sp. 31Argb]|uniref:hypothetical protein n=1 Tax=Bradyrhizobium sp. 31Argb TaxID=3141247 RepID=UPI00374842BA